VSQGDYKHARVVKQTANREAKAAEKAAMAAATRPTHPPSIALAVQRKPSQKLLMGPSDMPGPKRAIDAPAVAAYTPQPPQSPQTSRSIRSIRIPSRFGQFYS
jgi:hypothetical protein